MNFHPATTLCSVSLIAALPISCQEGGQDRSPVAAREASSTPLDDDAIETTIERELMLDPGVRVDRVDVAVVEGVAELSGTVDNLLARERASRIAEIVKGVSAVVNRIEVEPPQAIDDEDIRADVVGALLVDPATDEYEVDVTVEDGQVTLTGQVEGWAERTLCETVAKGVPGVVGVDDRIELRQPQIVSDAEIEATIKRRLHWDHLVDDALVRVEVIGGEVELSGTVGSLAEKSRANRKAWVQGVQSVDDSGLAVARWARDPDLRAGKYAPKADSAIREAVLDALLFDPRVHSFEIDVHVDSGMATLRGVVDNLEARRAATQDAANTVGVYTVRNFVKVRPKSDDGDDAIAERVDESLRRDPWVEPFEVSSSVDGGVVRLVGKVDTVFERLRAGAAVARVNGVVAVANDLAVRDGHPYTSDLWVDPWVPYDTPVWTGTGEAVSYEADIAIENGIRDELFWSPFVDSDDVDVSVENGVARLTGAVESWSAWRAARDNAYEGGASKVINTLDIEPAPLVDPTRDAGTERGAGSGGRQRSDG